MSYQLKKPIQEGANSAAASNEPPSSPIRRADSSKQSVNSCVNVHEEAVKPFVNHSLDNVDKKGGTDSPEGDIEDKGGTLPIPVQDANASSALVAGTNTWSPEMGIENFCFSHGQEWKLSEFVGPKCPLSQVLVPNTFQRHSIPFLHK